MKNFPKFLLLASTVFFVAQSCSNDEPKNPNGDSAKNATTADSMNKIAAKDSVPAVTTKAFTYAPDSGDVKKFMVRIYNVLKNNDSLVWRSQFTEEIQSRFHTPEELYRNFDVWRDQFLPFVNDNCGGDPEKMIVNKISDGVEVKAGKVSHKLKAKMVDGQWKFNEM